jgi:hypothetical protein
MVATGYQLTRAACRYLESTLLGTHGHRA